MQGLDAAHIGWASDVKEIGKGDEMVLPSPLIVILLVVVLPHCLDSGEVLLELMPEPLRI